MKKVLAFIKKEVLHILRDRRTLLILFGMPIVQIMLFGYAITNEIRNANIAILDKSNDEVTHELTQKLLSSGYFHLYEKLQNDEDIERVFRTGIVKQAIVFEPQFAQKFAREGKAYYQIIADATDPNTGATLIGYTQNIVQNYLMQVNATKTVPIIIIPEVKMIYNPEMKGVYYFVPGIITILLNLVSAMMTSIAIAREKELGTMEILLASPLRPIQIVLGKVAPYLFLATVNTTVIILLGVFVFGVPVVGSVFLLGGVCILFAMTALSLGIFISSISNSQQTAMLISLMGLMLPTMLLSGFIFPIENMPLPLQVLAQIFPPKWFLSALRAVMLKGVDITYIWKEILVLLFMFTVFVGLSVKNFKIRLQ